MKRKIITGMFIVFAFLLQSTVFNRLTFFLSAFVAAIYEVFGLGGLILVLLFLTAIVVCVAKLAKTIKRKSKNQLRVVRW